MSLTIQQQKQIEDLFFSAGYSLAMLRCGLVLKEIGEFGFIIKASIEYPAKWRAYDILLEEIYREAIKEGLIKEDVIKSG